MKSDSTSLFTKVTIHNQVGEARMFLLSKTASGSEHDFT